MVSSDCIVSFLIFKELKFFLMKQKELQNTSNMGLQWLYSKLFDIERVKAFCLADPVSLSFMSNAEYLKKNMFLYTLVWAKGNKDIKNVS